MKPGTRVKKVRGGNYGLTAVVVGYDENPGWPAYTMKVRTDSPSVSVTGILRPAGMVLFTNIYEWEPIIPSGHQPSTFTMDVLLESLAEQSVPSDPVSTS